MHGHGTLNFRHYVKASAGCGRARPPRLRSLTARRRSSRPPPASCDPWPGSTLPCTSSLFHMSLSPDTFPPTRSRNCTTTCLGGHGTQHRDQPFRLGVQLFPESFVIVERGFAPH